ncbi:hypothetical protein ACFW9D_14215 [Streptomyces sp. NPDC059524]|uniref:hypothetical protein n=1 Tax=Streptomyces sp. NPDC059524 TaxID=3346856 RepID=UPI0036ABA390
MSTDYATLVSAIILGSLAAGTVHTYNLVRKWTNVYTDAARAVAEARARSVAAIRDGNQPDPDDLQLVVDTVVQPRILVWRTLKANFFVMPWMAVCVFLIVTQVDILKWMAVAKPQPDPGLARLSFYVASAAVILLVAEGIIRAFAHAITHAIETGRMFRETNTEENRAWLTALSQHVQADDDATPRNPSTQPNL